MARVSDVSRTGPEGGRSAPSPLGREGAEAGLSKLMRSVGGSEGLSVPFVSSNSKSACPVSGVSKSYLPESTVGRSFETGASRMTESGVKVIGVTGRGEGKFATRGAVSSASWTVRALWITEGELVAAFLAVGMQLSTIWSTGLLVSKAVRLH